MAGGSFCGARWTRAVEGTPHLVFTVVKALTCPHCLLGRSVFVLLFVDLLEFVASCALSVLGESGAALWSSVHPTLSFPFWAPGCTQPHRGFGVSRSVSFPSPLSVLVRVFSSDLSVCSLDLSFAVSNWVLNLSIHFLISVITFY